MTSSIRHILAVRPKIITADDAVEVRSESVSISTFDVDDAGQFGTAYTSRARKTPSPPTLTIILVPCLIDVQLGFAGDQFQQLGVGPLRPARSFCLDDLRQHPTGDVHSQHVTQIYPDQFENDAWQNPLPCRQSERSTEEATHQTAALDRQRQRRTSTPSDNVGRTSKLLGADVLLFDCQRRLRQINIHLLRHTLEPSIAAALHPVKQSGTAPPADACANLVICPGASSGARSCFG